MSVGWSSSQAWRLSRVISRHWKSPQPLSTLAMSRPTISDDDQVQGSMLENRVLKKARVEKGMKVVVEWQDGEERTFHACWLRDHCQCSKCMTSSGQKKDRPREAVHPDVKLLKDIKVNASDNTLTVDWSDHEEELVNFKGDWLRKFSYSGKLVEEESKKRAWLERASNDPLPAVNFSDLFSNKISEDERIWPWMSLLNERGFCMIRSTPCVEKTVKRVANLIGPTSHNIYGETFDVKVTLNPINIAYTDTALEPHMDLAYFESPPGLQFLHCMEFDASVLGGESTLIDGHAVAEEFQVREPDLFNVLTTVPATFQKDHVDRSDPIKMFYQRPHIATNYLGQVTSVYWSPPFQGPLRVREDLVEPYYRAFTAFREMLMSEEMWERYGATFRMKPGDLLVFNNRRMLHGRNSFTAGGKRHLQGCYVDVDTYLNKYRVLSSKLSGNAETDCLGPLAETRFGISSHR